jgi:hypothetical protein
MGNVVLFMLLGWLGCTLIMTIRASRSRAIDDLG